MTMLPTATYRFSATSIKLPVASFIELEPKKIKYVWRHKNSTYPKQSWERRMEFEEWYTLTSDYNIKLQKSKECGTGTKTDT